MGFLEMIGILCLIFAGYVFFPRTALSAFIMIEIFRVYPPPGYVSGFVEIVMIFVFFVALVSETAKIKDSWVKIKEGNFTEL